MYPKSKQNASYFLEYKNIANQLLFSLYRGMNNLPASVLACLVLEKHS